MTTHSGPRASAFLDIVAATTVTIAALCIIGFAISRWLSSGASTSAATNVTTPPTQIGPVPDEPHPLEGSPILGNTDARVALIQYADFQCPFCVQFVNEQWRSLKSRYVDTGKVLISFRHLPLPTHPDAAEAAANAVCAAQQGHFWSMHDHLFAAHSSLGTLTQSSLTSELGLDPTQFARCLKTADEVVKRDLTLAASYGLHATPSFLIGLIQPDDTVKVRTVLIGAQPFMHFAATLDALLAD